MRVSREQAAQTRERILDTASRLFREKGFEGIGIADLMKAAGLTHGGFYKHFESKEELIEEVCTRTLQASAEACRSEVAAHPGQGMSAVADYYLSPEHRDQPGLGCALAALGAEMARRTPKVRQAGEDGVEGLLATLQTLQSGGEGERRRRAIVSLTELVGGLILARAVADPKLSEEILAAVRSELS